MPGDSEFPMPLHFKNLQALFAYRQVTCRNDYFRLTLIHLHGNWAAKLMNNYKVNFLEHLTTPKDIRI